jgi:hypothetical protein
MELWTMWTNILESALGFFITYFGFSDAVAIILLTLLARALMMPFSLTSAYARCKSQCINAFHVGCSGCDLRNCNCNLTISYRNLLGHIECSNCSPNSCTSRFVDTKSTDSE